MKLGSLFEMWASRRPSSEHQNQHAARGTSHLAAFLSTQPPSLESSASTGQTSAATGQGHSAILTLAELEEYLKKCQEQIRLL